MGTPEYVTAVDGGTIVAVFVQPRARKDAAVGFHSGALKIKLKAPARDNKANAALESFLADALGVPARSVSLVSGATSRNKRVLVEGLGPAEVAAALGAVLSSRAHEPGS